MEAEEKIALILGMYGYNVNEKKEIKRDKRRVAEIDKGKVVVYYSLDRKTIFEQLHLITLCKGRDIPFSCKGIKEARDQLQTEYEEIGKVLEELNRVIEPK